MHVTAFPMRKERATESPYKVNYFIELAGKVHTIAETLIKSCTIDIAESLLVEKSVKGYNEVPHHTSQNDYH